MSHYLRPGTLGLFYFCKFAELICLTIFTVLMINSGITLILDIIDVKGKENHTILLVAASACLVLSVFNLFYNNLLINLRFKTNLSSRSLGLCMYTFLNYLFCHCFLLKPCRDKFNTGWFWAKWLFKAVVFGFTIYHTSKYNEKKEMFDESNVTNFDTFLWIYLFQHAIFLVARLPIFIIFSIVTCCCSKGDELKRDENGELVEYPERPLFKDHIISYDYIEWQEDANHHFEHHQYGFAEFEYNRRLASMRVVRQAERQAEVGFNDMAASQLARSARAARKTIVGAFVGKSVFGDECPICYMNFEEGEKVEIFDCHPTHMMHEGCYAMFKKTNEKYGKRSVCPQCRFPIDETKIKRKLLQKKVVDEHDDPFDVKKENDGAITPRNKVADEPAKPNSVAPQVEMPEVMGPHGDGAGTDAPL